MITSNSREGKKVQTLKYLVRMGIQSCWEMYGLNEAFAAFVKALKAERLGKGQWHQRVEVGYGEPRESSRSVLAERYCWARDLGRRMQKISMGN